MITLPPLPTFSVLVRALLPQKIDDAQLVLPWHKDPEKTDYFWFSRSSWSLYFIAQVLRSITSKKELIIWVPDYFCEQALWQIRKSEISIFYYPIKSDLSPDIDYLAQVWQQQKPDLVLQVHYFGRYNDTLSLSKLCKQYGVFFIEDAAHVLTPSNDIGLRGDFVLYSQHKLFALPDGALCLMRKTGIEKKIKQMGLAIETYRDTCHKVYNALMKQKPDSTLRWCLKRMIQKIIPYRWGMSRLRCPSFKSTDGDSIVKENSPCMAPGSKKLLAIQIKALPHIKNMRIKNDQMWAFMLKQCYGIDIPPSSSEEVLYLYPVFPVSEDVERCYDQLKAAGMPVQTWPDLSASITQEKSSIAYRLRHQGFFISLHQSLESNVLFKLYAQQLLKKRIIETSAQHRIDVTEVTDPVQWGSLLQQASFSNMLQEWQYGEVKKQAEHWQPRRFVLAQNDQPVALVQVLIKQIGCKWIKVVRVNRGPVFLNNTIGFFQQYHVLKAVKKLLSTLGIVTLWAPELSDTDENKILLKQLKLHQRGVSQWSSGYVDLSLEESELRAGLRGNWRNQLKATEEKYGVIVELLDPVENKEWLIEQYHLLQARNKFSGLSEDLLRAIIASRQATLLCAMRSAQRVGFVLLYKHGLACTYLIGYTSATGREFYANNLLLWQAILVMKRQKYLWFDVGGLGKETLSIADFKRGLNLKEYTLVGEYITVSASL